MENGKSIGFATMRRVCAGFIISLSIGVSVSARATDAVLEETGPTWVTLPTTTTGPLQSIKVLAPGSGFMMVTAVGTLNYSHTFGTEGFYCLELAENDKDNGGCVPDTGSKLAIRSYIASGVPTTKPNYGTGEAYSIIGTWPVVSGKTYTFYLNGYATGMTGGTYLFQPTITALYVDTALSH